MIRIVKLTFKEDKIEEIVSFLDSVKHIINGFEGCQGVQFLHDIHNPQIIMTYSIWDSENALNNYRHSEKFSNDLEYTQTTILG